MKSDNVNTLTFIILDCIIKYYSQKEKSKYELFCFLDIRSRAITIFTLKLNLSLP